MTVLLWLDNKQFSNLSKYKKKELEFHFKHFKLPAFPLHENFF